MAVRSKRLWGPVQVGTSGLVVYTAPSAETPIIKSIGAYNPGALASVLTFYVGAAVAANALATLSVPGTGSAMLNGLFWCLVAGDQLRIVASAGNVTVHGHGAELEGAAD